MKTLAFITLLFSLVTTPSESSVLSESTATPSPQHGVSPFEQSLIRTWHPAGDLTKSAYIAASGSTLFVVNGLLEAMPMSIGDKNAFTARRGDILLSAIVSGDCILWSDGTWWSRSPVSFWTTTPKQLAGRWNLVASTGYQANVILRGDGTGTHSAYGNFRWQIVGNTLFFGSPESAADKFELPIQNGSLNGINRLGNTLTLTRQ
ncbi:MAG: hypothetical protein ABSE62_16670 [Chthoniobacteraceae bacterium]|jgi:hypothetical protein